MNADTIPEALGIVLLAYVAGSLPFGIIVTRLFTSIDIRRAGSRNIGATNVRRLAGTRLGILTLIGDVAKGAVPVWLACHHTSVAGTGNQWLVALTTMAAFAGHLFPIFLKFKDGGKGVATAAGCFLVIAPLALLASLVVFSGAVYKTKRVSVGSLAAVTVLPVAVWLRTHSAVMTAAAMIIMAWIYSRHADNIRRLAAGTEPVVGARPATEPEGKIE
ncbi:MAG: glycerol-3-phosphate 1-O-acyltransferase PlsY [Desulfobacterales bacterium]|nr:glycerol-3-phosphate 1-O-acyltransferase PlsY [Desulfobacterales bacterium]